MMRTKFAAPLFVLIAACTAQNASAANLLTNGGFETPVQGPPDYAAFNVPAGSSLITGWNVVQGNVDLTTNVNYGPGKNTLDTASVQDIDLIGDTNGSNGVKGGLSQSFATVTGQSYRLTFDYSHNDGTFSANGYAAQVTIANANVPANTALSAQVSQTYGASPWVAFSETFVANSDQSLLTFIDTQGAFNAGIYLDDVSVALVAPAVPELSTWAMMVMGFLGLGTLVRRRGAFRLA